MPRPQQTRRPSTDVAPPQCSCEMPKIFPAPKSWEFGTGAGTVRANFLAITSTSCDPTVSRMSPTFYNFLALSCTTSCDPTVSKRMSPMRVPPTMVAIRNPKKTATGTSSSDLCNPTYELRGVDNPDDKELAEHLDAEEALDAAAVVLRDALSNLCKAIAHLDTAEGLRCLRDALFSLFGATTVLVPDVEKDTLSAEDRLRDAFEDLRDAISLSATLRMAGCKDLSDPANMLSLSLTMTDTLDAGHRPRAADEGLVGAEEELGNLCNAMI